MFGSWGIYGTRGRNSNLCEVWYGAKFFFLNQVGVVCTLGVVAVFFFDNNKYDAWCSSMIDSAQLAERLFVLYLLC